ncbi:MAG: Hpt domain-containing protein [Gammaproteobacteria bacterium]|nr:Hpt domain-containing protein [Gammaproteobacteria bacterium]
MGADSGPWGLQWLTDEVGTTLEAAGDALEMYLRDPSDRQQLQFCRAYLHQVAGSLEMTDCRGGAQLLAEMEALVDALLSDAVGDRTVAGNALAAAAAAVPGYLSLTIAARSDQPAVLLSQLNDLHALLGQPLATETDAFNPDLGPFDRCGQSPPAAIDRVELAALCRKLRQIYQLGLLSLLKREQLADRQLNLMCKVAERMQELFAGHQRELLWRAGHAVLAGLRAVAPPGPALHQLLRELDRDLRACCDPAAFATHAPPVARSLMKNLLYYVSIAGDARPGVPGLRTLFRLDQTQPQLLPEHAGRTAPQHPITMLGDELAVELRTLQELSEQQVDAGITLEQAAATLSPPLLRVRDTLVAAAHPAAAAAAAAYHLLAEQPIQISWPQWADQISALEALVCDQATPALGASKDPGLRRIAWVDGAAAAVVATVRGLFDEIQDAVVSYISARNDPLHLEGLPGRAAQIAHALTFIEQDRLALVVAACGDHVARQLMCPDATASWSELDALADTLIACEYYLESLAQADTVASERCLRQAESKAVELAVFAVASPRVAVASGAPADVMPLPAAPAGPPRAIGLIPATLPTALDNPASDVGADPEIGEIFVAEAREVLESLRELETRSPGTRAEVLVDLRRGFHTLKGSGRMVGATAIAALAWAVENLLNRIRDGDVPWSAAVAEIVSDAIVELSELVEAFAAGSTRELDATGIRLCRAAENLACGREGAIPTEIVPGRTIQRLSPAFSEEAKAQLETVAAYVAMQRSTPASPPSAAVSRALHMLVGCCERTGDPLLPRVLRALEALVNLCGERGQPPDAASLDLFDQALAAGRALLTGDGSVPVDLARLGDQLESVRADLTRPAVHEGREHLHQLMAQGLVQLLALPERLAGADADREESHSWLSGLAAELEELAQGANAADLPALAELGALLAAASRRHSGVPLVADTITTLRTGADLLLGMLDAVASGQPLAALTAAQRDALTTLGAASAVGEFARAAEPEFSATGIVSTELGTTGFDAAEPGAPALVNGLATAAEATAVPASTDWTEHSAPDDRDRVDAELVGVFLEEAADLGEQLEHALNQWRAGADPLQSANSLKRALHTLKGGARMAGCRTLGTLCHDFETLVLRAEAAAEAGSDDFFAASLVHYDKIETELEHIHTLLRAPEAPLRAAASAPVPTEPVVQPPTSLLPPITPRHAEPPRTRVGDAPRVPAPWRASATGAKNRPGEEVGGAFAEPREMVKIAAPILDNLVNLVGETSISRSRIEQQLHQFQALLEEMETTVARFHDQVRRLSVETEVQTLLRREELDIGGGEDDFDPLEMDRYSQLQQLARGLEESASDLQDLKDTLLDKAQDTETLLVQQARVNRDLHENLTLTRMVPFSRVVPRLRRIVRQTASELDKSIELRLDNVEGEMDRAVLERIVPSLEHLIRNAIDHGIESSERRRLAGKPEAGVVAITFAREAGDIVIRLSDDGRGLDVAAIRAKAASLDLLPPGIELGDQDIMQLIFRPGFSTSQAVSQISGRGLGMDVVDNEVRQLGGAVSLTSRRDYGTEFTLRLPFTASVNRALLMKAGGELYGVLLNSVAGVVKLNDVELASLYADPEQRLHFDGDFYKICPLVRLLDGAPSTLPAAAGKLSVLLVKGTPDNVAVQVDALEPSQEIVVKSLGPQFAKVRGLAGATLLGDGRVVPIVDLVALIADRGGSWRRLPQPALLPVSGPSGSAVATPAVATTIVVVDDSVTVRKATSRLLERHGYRVLTARDGLEAMQLLQEVRPDLMLLDIEMPRMDGFEVARQVRASEPLRTLPIAMITSRTGDKHREKALALGVNRYLGKPYQEDVLLAAVQELLAKP